MLIWYNYVIQIQILGIIFRKPVQISLISSAQIRINLISRKRF